MEKITTYLKKEIKTEADLPKEDLTVIAHEIDSMSVYLMKCMPIRRKWWLENIDWYLLPKEYTEEDIEKWVNENYPELWSKERYFLVKGAKAVLNGEISKD